MTKKLSFSLKKPNKHIKVKIHDITKQIIICKKNKQILLNLKSNSIIKKNQINYFIKTIKNSFISLEHGWFIELKLNGIGYKSFYIKNKLILDLGYSNLITYIIPKEISIWNLKTKLFFYSQNKSYLNTIIYQLKKFSLPEAYTGKGVLVNNEIIKLKSKAIR